jgi:hypothetical protein
MNWPRPDTRTTYEIDDDFVPADVTFHCVNEDVSNEHLTPMAAPEIRASQTRPRDGKSFWIPKLADLLLEMIRIIPNPPHGRGLRSGGKLDPDVDHCRRLGVGRYWRPGDFLLHMPCSCAPGAGRAAAESSRAG